MRFDAELWRHDGGAGWYFVTLPHDIADEIAECAAKAHRPFGMLPVRATIGGTTWTTSLFADTRRASYLLPVKADVRRREQLEAGQRVDVAIELAAA